MAQRSNDEVFYSRVRRRDVLAESTDDNAPFREEEIREARPQTSELGVIQKNEEW